MRRFIASRINLILFTFAATMTLCASLVGARATDTRIAATTARPDHHHKHSILFRRGALDTSAQTGDDTSMEDLLAVATQVNAQSAAPQLRVVQFHDAVKGEWVKRLRATGAEIVGYVPHNAFLIRGGAEELARVAALNARERADEERPVRWMSRLLPIQKIAPELDAKIISQADASASDTTVDIEVELLDVEDAAADIAYIQSVASGAAVSERRFLRYIIVSARVPASNVAKIAALDAVLFIEPKFLPALEDERSVQIIAGNLNADHTQPAGAGYRDWLAARGLDTQPDYVIDFADSGIDRGSTLGTLLHPDFLDAQGQGRVAYVKNYASGSSDKRGHGTLVASIATGLGGAGRMDEDGYLYGLGVDPRARIGSSRIFGDDGKLPTVPDFTGIVSAAYAAGARISNNSWGNGSNAYNLVAQEYDALVRDAQPTAAGNQQMVFVFSTGNGGAGGNISAPGTAKNVITVAASESYRPEGEDACNFDGAGGVGPGGADNAMDMLRFSAGGPTLDFRAKPDITAPGTHIQGAATQAPGAHLSDGLCPGPPNLRPALYAPFFTWSSGTSLAAPHVAGAASLVRRHFTQNALLAGAPPSPAMTKAFLINSASYLTGEGAGGSLPHERQGYGLLNLGRAFAAAQRHLVDQTHLFTESGQTFEIQGSLANRDEPLRVTLAWTDAPGSPIGAALVNDLDLEIKVGDETVYRGNRFAGQFSEAGGEADRLNNVEAILIPAGAIPEGAAGNFTVTVRAVNIVGDGVPNNAGSGAGFDQDFALVITNIAEPHTPPPPPPPPKKVPLITSVTYVKKLLTISGRDFTAAARVEINGKPIDMVFTFDAATNSLSIRLKAKKLKLIPDADNQIVLIEGNERSQPFVVRV